VQAVRNRKLASQMVSRAPKGRSKVTNGRQLFIDGDARLKVSRRLRDVLASIATDLGGADRLSEGQKQIARRCAMLSVIRAFSGKPRFENAVHELQDAIYQEHHDERHR
jgi:hypothetical protein